MGCMMSKKLNILILIGSARKKSANGGVVTQIQNFTFNGIEEIMLSIPALDHLPIFSEDEERKNPISEEIQDLKKRVREAAGIIFVTPEINGSLSPLILNAFVWSSRFQDQKGRPLLQQKKATVISASFLSENQIIDCVEIGKQLNMKFMEKSFHIFLGNKSINEAGKIVSASEKERLEKWYKEFIRYLKSK